MDQVSAASRFFAEDAWVQSLDWRADEQVLQVTIANRHELRAGRFLLPVSVQLLVPTNEQYPYMWFAAGSHGACRRVQRVLEMANRALEKDTIASIGLVAVVSSLVLQFRDQAAIIWPIRPSKSIACRDARVGEAHALSDGRFEHSVSSAELNVIAPAITDNLRGCELLLLLLQLGANSAGFERLCNPFPESFRDSATGRYQVARLRDALVVVPPLQSIPSIVRRFYANSKPLPVTGDELNSTGSSAHSSPKAHEPREEKNADAGKAGSDEFEGALTHDVALLLFWAFSYAPFCLRPTQVTQDAAKNIPPSYESFDILHRSRVPNFNAQATMHGQMRAYHGSHASNWFSIISNKLQNLSGTEHQANGALFGKGVYLARGSSVADVFANVATISLDHCRYAQALPGTDCTSPRTTPLLGGADGASKAAISILAECAVVKREAYCRHLNPSSAKMNAAGGPREEGEVDDSLYIVVNNAEDVELRRILVKVTSIGAARAQWAWVLLITIAVATLSAAWSSQY